MGKYFIILFLLLAANALAQPPRIDSMAIDESAGILSIYGTFDSIPGRVSIDSLPATVKSWSSSRIQTSIVVPPNFLPVQGTGGTVIVSDAEGRKDSSYITVWFYRAVSFELLDGWPYPSTGRTSRTDDYELLFRGELVSAIRQHKLAATFGGMLVSRYTQTMDDNGNKTTWTDSAMHYSVRLSLVDTTVEFAGLDCQAYLSDMPLLSVCQPGMDSAFQFVQIPFFERNGWYHNNHYPANQSVDFNRRLDLSVQGGARYLPPSSTLALRFSPVLIAPADSSDRMSPDSSIWLTWRLPPLLNSSHVEVSADSYFVATVIDTVVAVDRTFQFPPLPSTRYYWRVAGINSEGQSRWSPVWHFTTVRDSAEVMASSALEPTFTCTPNPATNILNITLPAPARVVLYDLRGNVVRSVSTSEPTLRIETGYLASGTYIIGVFTNGKRSSTTVSIVH